MTEAIAGSRRSPADERAIDAELADSFPASDPPSWTTGIAETGPRPKPRRDPDIGESVDRPSRTAWLTSLGGLVLVVWAVPLALVALPVALIWRAVKAASLWRPG